jgi:Hemerythrin HHE cation binding domain
MIREYFTHDHRRLETLLRRAFPSAGTIDETTYAEFRAGLLKHIASEEKILIPALKSAQEDTSHASAAQLRQEHGALASLLVLPPSVMTRNAILGLLHHHNKREESAHGLHEECDCLPSDSVNELMQKTRIYPDVPVLPYNASIHAYEAARRAVARAGYDLDALANTKQTPGEDQ